MRKWGSFFKNRVSSNPKPLVVHNIINKRKILRKYKSFKNYFIEIYT